MRLKRVKPHSKVRFCFPDGKKICGSPPIVEKERITKKLKAKDSCEKRVVGRKKRAQPEKNASSDVPPGPKTPTKATPKSAPIATPKDTPKAAVLTAPVENCPAETPKDPPQSDDDFGLRKEQDFFKKLVADQNSKFILSKKKKVDECLKAIQAAGVTVDQLRESKLGLDLQQFVNICGRTPLLAEVQKSASLVLNKLKQNVICSFFGDEEQSSPGKNDASNSASAGGDSVSPKAGSIRENGLINNTSKPEDEKKSLPATPHNGVKKEVPESNGHSIEPVATENMKNSVPSPQNGKKDPDRCSHDETFERYQRTCAHDHDLSRNCPSS